ncbi:MAG: thiolase family protein [Hyphomicrobiales bacterium]|nr:MAG: thiolase family protein [Hyphomicrobiales bacterium]
MRSAVIVDAVRTAVGKGKPGGALSGLHPVDLYATTLRALVDRVGLDPALVEDAITGCVSQVGEQSVNLGRNAVLSAGFPAHVPATTIDRQCGSSQQAVHFAAQGIMAGAYDVVIAGGAELMSRVPLGSSSMGKAPRGSMYRERFADGLPNQGVAAELIAAQWKLSRGELDEFAARSHHRAAKAQEAGSFASEIVPIDVPDGSGGIVTHAVDETVRGGTTVDALANLSASFRDDAWSERYPEIGWHITPGNSSPLTDGASAMLIMSEERAAELGLRARARIHAFSVVGDDPLLMLTGPIPATRRVLERANLKIDDIDVFEVNEAFASVPLAWARELGVDEDKLNPWGGAIALGHPLGASGTKLMTTMLSYLEFTGGRFGLQTMCEGGGMANATIIERLPA